MPEVAPNKWARIGRRIAPVALLVLVAAGLYQFRSQEPRYQKQRLTIWLDELTGVRPHPESGATLEIRHERAVAALRHMGNSAVPFLLKYLREDPQPGWLQRRMEWLLEKQSILRFKFPAYHSRGWQVVEAFRALGPKGDGAIPELAQLLNREPP